MRGVFLKGKNMQIIIELNEATYNDIKQGKIYSSVRDVPQESVMAIARGVPLPKGHGRMIDGDKLLAQAQADGAYDYVSAREIANAPTVLEADKEGN